MSDPRLSYQTMQVLRSLIDADGKRISGSDIARNTAILSGTLYPILMRLERAGWISSQWETAEPSRLGRPRKRLYKLLAKGKEKSADAFALLRSSEEG